MAPCESVGWLERSSGDVAGVVKLVVKMVVFIGVARGIGARRLVLAGKGVGADATD